MEAGVRSRVDTVVRPARVVPGGRDQPLAILIGDGMIAPGSCRCQRRRQLGDGVGRRRRYADRPCRVPRSRVRARPHRLAGIRNCHQTAARGGITEIVETPVDSVPATVDAAVLEVWEVSLVAHHLDQLRGGRPADNPFLRPDADHMSPPEIYMAARKAIEGGQPELAVIAVRERIGPEPYDQAVLALIEAKVDDSEDRWHDALRIAADHHLRPVVVDALEGLAVAAGRSESWAECLPLYGAAQRLRDECEYRWRFASEQSAIDQAIGASHSQLGPDAAATAEADGRELAWPDAVQ